MSMNSERLLRMLVRAGTRYAAEKAKGEEAENAAPEEKQDSFTVGAVMLILGAVMMLLSGGRLFALPLILSGAVSLAVGAGKRLAARKKEPQGEAEQSDGAPQTERSAKKLAEQKQFLDSGLISREEYDENCARIRAKEKNL